MTTDPNVYAAPAPQPPLTPAEEKQWAVLTHLLGIFFGIITAAVFFFLYRDRGPFIRSHVVTEWNFRLTQTAASALVFLVAIIGWAIAFATAFTGQTGPVAAGPAQTGVTMFVVAWFAMLTIQVLGALFGILATVAASKGRRYRFSLAIPFVRA